MDGSFVGRNPTSLVPPSGRIDYTVRAPAEGVFLMYSTAANATIGASGGGSGGKLSTSLFGSVVVEPATSEWYRSQVTKADLDAATTGRSADGHPLLNYGALRKEQDGTRTPVPRMVDVEYKINPNGICVPAGHDVVTAPPSSDPKRASRVYKAADVQMDVVFNKAGWHFPQLRFQTLWQDVMPTLAGKRAPEPLFIRANSGETIEFWQTNLIPDYYELDDFQVRTPTDVIGQHVHLVKFDVTSSDGAANGYNYEAGSLSEDAVRGKIAGIRKANMCAADATISFQCSVAKAHRSMSERRLWARTGPARRRRSNVGGRIR
jgi:hypothetical protein